MRGQLEAQVARLDVSSAPPAVPTIPLGPITAMANDPSKSQNATAAPFIALDTETDPNEPATCCECGNVTTKWVFIVRNGHKVCDECSCGHPDSPRSRLATAGFGPSQGPEAHSDGHPHNFPGPLTATFTTPGDILETWSSQPARMQCEAICAGMLPLSHYSEQTLSSMRWHDFNARATGRGGTVWACRECKASLVRVEEMREARFCANCNVHLKRDNTSRAQLARTRGRARCLTCVARDGRNGASTS